MACSFLFQTKIHPFFVVMSYLKQIFLLELHETVAQNSAVAQLWVSGTVLVVKHARLEQHVFKNDPRVVILMIFVMK